MLIRRARSIDCAHGCIAETPGQCIRCLMVRDARHCHAPHHEDSTPYVCCGIFVLTSPRGAASRPRLEGCATTKAAVPPCIAVLTGVHGSSRPSSKGSSPATRRFFLERCQTTPGKPFNGTSGSPV